MHFSQGEYDKKISRKTVKNAILILQDLNYVKSVSHLPELYDPVKILCLRKSKNEPWFKIWVNDKLTFVHFLEFLCCILERLTGCFQTFLSSWLNHVMHSNIIVFIILELFTSFRKYPKRKAGLVGLSIFMLAYLVWIHIIKHNAGIWVYPILEVLNLPQRILFFVVQILFAIGLYVVGDFVNEQIWTREIKQAAKLASRKTK